MSAGSTRETRPSPIQPSDRPENHSAGSGGSMVSLVWLSQWSPSTSLLALFVVVVVPPTADCADGSDRDAVRCHRYEPVLGRAAPRADYGPADWVSDCGV